MALVGIRAPRSSLLSSEMAFEGGWQVAAAGRMLLSSFAPLLAALLSQDCWMESVINTGLTGSQAPL
jgi:hypothetical protein